MKQRARITGACGLGLVLLTLSAGLARGNVTILDSQYHAWGGFDRLRWDSASEQWVSEYIGYDKTSSLPVSGAVSYEGTQATSNAFTSQVSTYGRGGSPVAPTASAFAEYITTFTPLSNDLSITFMYNSAQVEVVPISGGELLPTAWGYASLKDLTSGTTVINTGSRGTGLFGQTATEYLPDVYPADPYFPPGMTYWERYDIAVDPAHTYQLRLYSQGGGNLDWVPDGGMTVTSSIPGIPAPAALLLSALGAGCVAWLRSRRTL